MPADQAVRPDVIAASVASRVLAAALAVSLTWGGWQWIQLKDARHALAQTEIVWTKALVDNMAKARKQEREWQAHADEVGRQHQSRLDAIEAEHDQLVADLRAGNVRLRDHWLSAARERDANAADAARLADENARLREESAGRIVRAVEQCESVILGWQEFWRGVKR